MNALDRKIERYLEDWVEKAQLNLSIAEETLAIFRHHHRPHLASVEIGFTKSKKGAHFMATATAPGPVTLSSVGQSATARLFYFDQNGKPMADGFKPPAAAFSVNDTEGKVVKATDNGDNTATVVDVADGTAVLSVVLKGAAADGSDITASQSVTVSNGGGEPAQVFTSVGIGFDS